MAESKYKKLNRQVFENPMKDPTIKQRAGFALRYIGSGKRVLDIGCANGALSRVLRDGGNHVVGVDILPEYVKMAKKNCSEAKVVDISRGTGFRAGSFDAVFAGEFIEHLTEKDADTFFRECRRVLKRGGLIILTTPNPDFIRIKLFRINLVGGAHLKVYPVKELKRLLLKFGFRPMGVSGLGKVAFLIGTRMPIISLYGDYGIVARKD